MTATTPDLWHHYGRSRAATDRDVPGSFSWIWGQEVGPWVKLLDEAGFTGVSVETWPAAKGPRAAATLLVAARR